MFNRPYYKIRRCTGLSRGLLVASIGAYIVMYNIVNYGFVMLLYLPQMLRLTLVLVEVHWSCFHESLTACMEVRRALPPLSN